MSTQTPPLAESNPRRNGLEYLANLGIPPAAITSLLIALAVLTLLPHAGGRDFGPYSMPQLVQIPTFWAFALLTPIVWVALLVRAHPFDKRSVLRLLKILGCVELVALTAAALTSPVLRTASFEFDIAAAQASKEQRIVIPFAQNIEVAVHGIAEPFQVHLYICEEAPQLDQTVESEGPKREQCLEGQRPADTPLRKWVKAGAVRVWLFNYEQNQRSLRGTLTVRYTTRRAI
jgi:hypothetical protein